LDPDDDGQEAESEGNDEGNDDDDGDILVDKAQM
jgi:hypothetical protein